MGLPTPGFCLVHTAPSPGLAQPLFPRPGGQVRGSGCCFVTLQHSVPPWASASLAYSSESWVCGAVWTETEGGSWKWCGAAGEPASGWSEAVTVATGGGGGWSQECWGLLGGRSPTSGLAGSGASQEGQGLLKATAGPHPLPRPAQLTRPFLLPAHPRGPEAGAGGRGSPAGLPPCPVLLRGLHGVPEPLPAVSP